MNKKGFTLIEVIIVIAIIAIISLLLVPNVISLIGKNNKESCENLKENIISATKIYVNMNKYELGFDCNNTPENITLQTLVNSGDLKTDENGEIINPIDDINILDEETDEKYKYVSVLYNCDSRTFSYNYDLSCE